MLAALCGPIGREILSLNLHPLQSNIPDTELLKAAEVVLMTVVAQVRAQVQILLVTFKSIDLNWF